METLIKRGATSKLPTEYGYFLATPYIQQSNGLEHLVLLKGEWKESDSVLVRIHSSCMTGDIFGSCRCDCGAQLHESMRMIEKEGTGIIIYLNQEGRGIGIFNKIHAYQLQDEGLDTVQANLALGFRADERDYMIGCKILEDLNVNKIRLITNNPDKVESLKQAGFKFIDIVPIEIDSNPENKFYLETKKNKMGHWLKNV
ncbi:GTP cyclohydrolase II [Prevotella conceptionensis]|uniref:GTP cyclohydrolase II n=1 Tax=Prevotella conceptionensis TaxID=340486 RepID=UPI0009FD0856|nr:GTP cyclohydrolase II [Prevotella conceptionensis]